MTSILTASSFSHASILVGIIFLFTSIAKVIEPWKFIEHIAKLKLLHPQLIIFVALTFTAIESALGIALILGVLPSVMIPVSILLLVGLMVLTYWSTSTRRTEDCGCYNGWLDITPTQSLILNTVYIFSFNICCYLWQLSTDSIMAVDSHPSDSSY